MNDSLAPVQIEIKNLRKSYRDADRELCVIENLNVEIPGGKSVGLIGRSGIGKSTLLHIMGALDRATSGSVLLGGVDITAFDSDKLAQFRGANIGFIFQFHHLLPEFNALENVCMPLWVAGVSEQKARERAEAVLTRVGLQNRLQHRPGELSGGEQQRVAIARAVVGEPRVILADEPTGNLDVNTGAEVRQLLLEIQAQQRSTLVVATHSRELAVSMDLVFEMQPGGELRKVTS